MCMLIKHVHNNVMQANCEELEGGRMWSCSRLNRASVNFWVLRACSLAACDCEAFLYVCRPACLLACRLV